MKARSLLLWAALLLTAGPVLGQAPSAIPDTGTLVERAKPARSPRTRTEVLKSRLMAREMPYRVILPTKYDARGEEGRRFPVLYLLHGLTGHFDNWTSLSSVEKHAADLNLIIVTPEGGNGWYTDALSKQNENYESYIIKELIPEIDRKYRTLDRRDQRAIAGLSMGGYGAVKFGLKYPEMFKIAGSFSGALGAASITEKQFPGAIGKTIDSIFGPAEGEIRKANDPFDIIRRSTPEKIGSFPFLYVDCGTEDFLLQNNRDFAALLLEKRIPHEYRQLPGAHNWTYWDKQIREFVQLLDRAFMN